MNKVTIITVCFNVEGEIRKTIESVLHQTYPNIEYLIVDGASSDGTVAAAKEYEQAFTERGYTYRIISEKDAGTYDAMNKGIRLASGTLIGMINGGDWYEPVAVETAANAYEEDHYDMFYADIRLIRRDGSSMIKHSRLDKIVTSRHWNHPTTFIPKAVYEEIGTYKNVGIHDDFDLLLRMKRANKNIVIRNIVLANFVVGGASNEKSWRKCLFRCKDRYRCYRSNGYSPLYIIECVAIELAKFLIS